MMPGATTVRYRCHQKRVAFPRDLESRKGEVAFRRNLAECPWKTVLAVPGGRDSKGIERKAGRYAGV